MDIFDTIIKRGSIRRFCPEQIKTDELNKILDAGEMAPIASKNYDSMMIIVIQDTTLLRKIGKTVGIYLGKSFIDPLYKAPACVIISGKEYQPFQLGEGNKIPQTNLEYINAGCIIENMTLAATDMGIGSVCITGALYAFTLDNNLLEQLNLPDNFRPLAGMVLGYPQKPLPNRRKRKWKIPVQYH